MFRFLLRETRGRPVRAAVLGGGIVVAAVAFTLLTAATRTSELHIRGKVSKNFRSTYDVLVRPRGARDSLERSSGLVRDNYLSGIYGGITLAQWRTIRSLPGVDVAAPVANVGFTLPFQSETVSIKRDLNSDPTQLYRVTTSWIANHVSVYPNAVNYVYYTRRGRFVSKTRWGMLAEVDPGRSGYTLPCYGFATPLVANGPFDPAFHSFLSCFAAGEPVTRLNGFPGSVPKSFVGTVTLASFPVAVAAIDPASEARLVGLKQAMVSGRYLGSDDRITLGRRAGDPNAVPFVPVIASTRSYVGDVLRIQVERLQVPPGTDVPRALETSACTTGLIPCPHKIAPPPGASYQNGRQFLQRLSGRTVEQRDVPISTFYRTLLAQPFEPGGVWTASGVSYHRLGPDLLRPRAVSNPTAIWQAQFGPAGYIPAPGDDEDVQYRRLRERQQNNTSTGTTDSPSLHVIGTFDPRKLPGFSPLSRVPLETFYPPVLEPADATSRKALKGQNYLPDQNLAGYVAQPPLVLTTLNMLQRYFLNPKYLGLSD